jgi:DNA adenine methylase
MKYFGGKNLAGLYQWIINNIPQHDTYIEPFAGSGAIYRLKRPALKSYLCELEPKAFRNLETSIGSQNPETAIGSTACLNTDGLEFIEENFRLCGPETFIYADPPYVLESRKSDTRYKFDWTDDHHHKMLDLFLPMKASIAISGYENSIYSGRLKGWRMVHTWAVTRSGKMAKECLWMNYAPPMLLHDSSYAGSGFTDRQRIKRKAQRWAAKFAALPAAERQAILQALGDSSPLSPPHPLKGRSSAAGMG